MASLPSRPSGGSDGISHSERTGWTPGAVLSARPLLSSERRQTLLRGKGPWETDQALASLRRSSPPTHQSDFLSSDKFPTVNGILLERLCQRHASPPTPFQHAGGAQHEPRASPQPPSPGGAPASARCTHSGCPGTSGPWPGPHRPPGPVSASGLRKRFQKRIRVSEKKATRQHIQH